MEAYETKGKIVKGELGLLRSVRLVSPPSPPGSVETLTVFGGAGCGHGGYWQRWLCADVPDAPSPSPQSWCWSRCWWRALGSAGCGPAADLWAGWEGAAGVGLGWWGRLELGSGWEHRWRRGLMAPEQEEKLRRCYCRSDGGGGGAAGGGDGETGGCGGG